MASRTQVARDNQEQPTYNVEMRAKKLRKLAARADAWRIQVWAQQGMRLKEINEQLAEMGQPPVDTIEFDPANQAMFPQFVDLPIPPK